MSSGFAKLASVVAVATLLLLFVPSRPIHAAVCCGGHAALPSLITGYETLRLNTTLSQSEIIGDAAGTGRPVFRELADRTDRRLFQVSGAWRFRERWQVGMGGALNPTGRLGDANLLLANETFPRRSLFHLRPSGTFFVQAQLPIGRSIYENSGGPLNEQSITGTGFYRLGFGVLGLTTWRKFDFYGSPRALYGFERRFESGLRVRPGWTANVLLGGGYSLSARARIGFAAQAVTTESRRTRMTGFAPESSPSALVWPLEIQWTYFIDESAVTFAYNDETLIGPVRTTTLTRTLSFQWSHRWSL